MTLQNSSNRNQAAVRQTVSSGSVDANGFPNALSIGAGLSVTLTATTTPFELSFAAGFNNGAIDYPARITTNQTIGSLTASTTLYLYADRDLVTGVVTFGFSVLGTTYGKAPASPTTGTTWFDLAAFLMKRWNGSAWITIQRVILGEVTTGASTVVSVTTYAYNGYFAGSWLAVVANTLYTINHNLGVPFAAAAPAIALHASTGGVDYDASPAQPAVWVSPSLYGFQWGGNLTPWKSISFSTRDYVVVNQNNIGWATTGYYKLTAKRGW